MLSVLFISDKGEGYGFAHKITQKGHIVKFWSANEFKPSQDCLKRPQQINRYEEHIESADIIIICAPGFGTFAQALRDRGKMVLGGGVQECLMLPEWQKEIAGLLQVSYHPVLTDDHPFVLGGWFDGNQWAFMYVGIMDTRMLENDRGPITDGMGLLIRQVDESMLDNITVFLKSGQYKGFITITFNTLPELSLVNINPFLDDLSLSAASEILKIPSDEMLMYFLQEKGKIPAGSGVYGIAVRLCHLDDELTVNKNEGALKHFWPEHQEQTIGIVTARGFTLREVRRRVYRTVDTLSTQAMIYRNDIGVITPWEEGDAAYAKYNTPKQFKTNNSKNETISNKQNGGYSQEILQPMESERNNGECYPEAN